MKFRYYRRWLALVAAVSLLGGVSAQAATLYTRTASETVSRGVIYSQTKSLTTEGYTDVYSLAIDLSQGHIQVKPVESASAYGLKETTQQLLTANGAVAGVNGDFFGMAGNYSDPFGLVVLDGNLHSAGTDRNVTQNTYTSLFFTEDGQAFFDYFRLQVQFLNNGASHIVLASMNKVSEMKYPIYFDREAGSSTAAVDARFPNVVKIVVQNDVITYISGKGETVQVPEEGYLILIPGTTYDGLNDVYAVGQTAELSLQTTVDLENVETAFSGGEWVLQNGARADLTGKTVVSTSRQPRTAMGLSQDGKTLYLAVVDGRGSSMGATLGELADIMKGLGAYNAVNLDGGGSSTLVAKTVADDSAVVKNKPSDGAQRKVINAVGVFDTAPVGAVTQLVVKPAAERVFVGQSLAVQVYGLDDYYHKITPGSGVSYSADMGTFANGSFVSNTPGTALLKAGYNGAVGTATVKVVAPAALQPAQSRLSLAVGDTAALSVTAVDSEGFTGAVSGITYAVSDPALGTVENGVFTARSEGSGYITCSWGSVSCQIAVGVGGTEQAVDLTGKAVSFSGYPTATATGSAVSDQGVVTLNYALGQSSSTQAAYALFGSGVALPANTYAVRLSVNGNSCGDWLRGRVRDANGKTYPIDFTKAMSFSGWQDLTAQLPAEAAQPLVLESVYLAALTNGDTTPQQLQFKNLRAIASNLPAGASSATADPLSQDISGKVAGSHYMTFAGNLALDLTKVEKPASYTDARVAAFNALQEDSNLYVYLGTTDISLTGSADRLTLNGGYRTFSGRGATLIRVNTTGGSIKNVDANQWASLQADALGSAESHILFLLDETPGNFTDSNETAMLRDFFQTLRQAGKSVVVVSTSGSSQWSTALDGVRYINLPDLWLADGSQNPNAAILRVKITGSDLTYEVQKLF